MSSYPIEHVVVTGANGYIGRRLVQMALAQGRAVTILGRTNPGFAPSIRFVQWELGDRLPVLDLPAKTTGIIHLAHDWQDRNADGTNLCGTRILLQDARERGAKRFVFVSSLSARRDALNAYGRIKWSIEQSLDGPDTAAARVGLVYGGPRKGMYGLMLRLVSVSPILPMIDPGRLVQPIHLDEVCRGLLALADIGATGWIGLAGPDPISFGDFLKTLAQEGRASSLRILPIPLRFALFAADVSVRIPFGPTIDKERILGLAGTQTLDCRDHLRALGLSVAPLRQGLRKDAIGARALLSEARVLCGFILGKAASHGLLRRYVRAVHALDVTAGPMPLPRLAHVEPSFLRFFEPLGASAPLTTRLRIAMALSEMSADYVPLLAASTGSGRTRRLTAMLLLIGIEIVAFPFRLLCTRRA